jgi:hypothetical protein
MTHGCWDLHPTMLRRRNACVSGIVIGAVATAALTKLAEREVWINFLPGWGSGLALGAEFLGSDDSEMGPLSVSG